MDLHDGPFWVTVSDHSLARLFPFSCYTSVNTRTQMINLGESDYFLSAG